MTLSSECNLLRHPPFHDDGIEGYVRHAICLISLAQEVCSFAMFAAVRRASSSASSLAADLRPGLA